MSKPNIIGQGTRFTTNTNTMGGDKKAGLVSSVGLKPFFFARHYNSLGYAKAFRSDVSTCGWTSAGGPTNNQVKNAKECFNYIGYVKTPSHYYLGKKMLA